MSWIEPRIVYETTLLKKSVSDVGNLICLSICKDSLGKTCLLNRLRVLSNRSEFLWIPFESKRFSLRKFLVCSSNQLHHQLTELYYLMIRVLYITYQARINLTTGASRIWRRKNKAKMRSVKQQNSTNQSFFFLDTALNLSGTYFAIDKFPPL